MQAVTETEIFIVAIIKSRVIETKIPIRDIRLFDSFYKIREIEQGKIIFDKTTSRRRFISDFKESTQMRNTDFKFNNSYRILYQYRLNKERSCHVEVRYI